MLPTSVIVMLRLIHIVVGVCWVGAVVFIAVFLLPAFKAVGPAAGPVMQDLTQVRRLPAFLTAGVLLTVLSGLALFYQDSAGFSGAWMSSGPGRTFSLGAALGLVVAVMGVTINAPTAKRLGAIAAAVHASGGPPSPDQMSDTRRLQGRLAVAMRTAAVLLVLAASAMAVARYVPA